MRFPLFGSAVLFSLFLAFKFLPQAWVNALLAVYIGSIAVVVLAGAMAPYFTDMFAPSLRSKSISIPPFKIPHVLDLDKPTIITLPQIVFGLLSLAFCTWCVEEAVDSSICFDNVKPPCDFCCCSFLVFVLEACPTFLSCLYTCTRMGVRSISITPFPIST